MPLLICRIEQEYERPWTARVARDVFFRRLLPYPSRIAAVAKILRFYQRSGLQQIARAMRLPVPDDPDPDGPVSVSVDEFRAATAMLRELGYPIEKTDEQAWPHFRGWRANYDIAALLLARQLDAPPTLWTGKRRWPSTPIPPRRPAAKLARDAQQWWT